MVLGTLVVALLFIAGLINIFFYIPTSKICSFLQILFPNNNTCKTNKSPVSPASTTPTRRSNNMRKEELRKVFSTFDKNGDGFITRQELKESLRNIRISMTDNEIDEIVVKFDSNGDGLLDFDEFCSLTTQMGGNGEEKEGEEGDEFLGDEVDLKEAFDVFDKDKDGLITVEELALVLTSLGLREGKRIQECKEMIKKVDMDGDGMVNFDEFKRMMISGGGKLFLAA